MAIKNLGQAIAATPNNSDLIIKLFTDREAVPYYEKYNSVSVGTTVQAKVDSVPSTGKIAAITTAGGVAFVLIEIPSPTRPRRVIHFGCCLEDLN